MSLSSYEHSIKFEFRQFPSIFCRSYTPFRTYNTGNTQFSGVSPTCFDILGCNFAYDFVLLYYRTSVSVIHLRQLLWDLCPFWNLEHWKYTVSALSLTYFDILSWNFAYEFDLLYYRSSSSVINLLLFLWELCPFLDLEYWKYTVFRTFSYMLWHIELTVCIWLYFTVLIIKFECRQFASIFVGVMPLL